MVQQLATGNGNNYQLPNSNYQFRPQDEEFLTPEIIEDESVNLEDRERRAILRALDHNQGNRKQAAADLHISERTLYRKLKEYNISE
jgi:DNA-binding NtrC family response regulator